MKPNLQPLFCIALLAVCGNVFAANLPKNILDQIPKDYEVHSFQSGELNDDKLVDYVVVLHKKNEKTVNGDDSAPARPLLLFIQNPDGRFTLVKRNDHVVFKLDEGGQCDPFDADEKNISIKNHYFTIENAMSCGQHWTDFITFRYLPALRDWVFHKRISENWVLNSRSGPDEDALVSEGRRVVSAKAGAPVLFENYKN